MLETPGLAMTSGDATPGTARPLEHPGRSARLLGKEKKIRHFMWKFVGGWLLVLALIVLAARALWPEDPSLSKPSQVQPPSMDENSLLLDHSLGTCARVFSGFLAAGTPETRNQFVLTPVTTALRMARFYSQNSLTSVDAGTLSLTHSGVFNLAGAKALETHWQSKNGQTLDAVFRLENNEWRLDWDDFARYSDYPWSLFLAGSGEPVGEFRLLARERLAEERKDSLTISVVLYAPRFGHPDDAGSQSPEFLLSRNSRNGQLLDAAFKLARTGKRVFGANLPNLNPEGMIRVRVTAQRTEVNLERKFNILEVRACHWYSVDDPGVEPSEPPAEQPSEPPAEQPSEQPAEQAPADQAPDR